MTNLVLGYLRGADGRRNREGRAAFLSVSGTKKIGRGRTAARFGSCPSCHTLERGVRGQFAIFNCAAFVPQKSPFGKNPPPPVAGQFEYEVQSSSFSLRPGIRKLKL